MAKSGKGAATPQEKENIEKRPTLKLKKTQGIQQEYIVTDLGGNALGTPAIVLRPVLSSIDMEALRTLSIVWPEGPVKDQLKAIVNNDREAGVVDGRFIGEPPPAKE